MMVKNHSNKVLPPMSCVEWGRSILSVQTDKTLLECGGIIKI